MAEETTNGHPSVKDILQNYLLQSGPRHLECSDKKGDLVSHRKTIIILLVVFALGAWAQNSPLRASPPIGAVVQTWHYDPVTKQLTIRVVNTSRKDITPFNISVTLK